MIDEAQDLSVPQMRFLAALGAGRPDALFFAGDRVCRFANTLSHRGRRGAPPRRRATEACDDEVLPLQCRIDAVGDDADVEEVYNTERHLLYVACTRAREDLMVTGVGAGSEFLEDLRG